MAIYNLGSINIDHVYTLAHLPAPGETLHAGTYAFGLGGKGMNQSVAAARAGASVYHIGAIGAADSWLCDRIQAYGVNCAHLHGLAGPSGHAIIYVDAQGENAIVINPGANAKLALDQVDRALASAAQNDTLLMQNETNLQCETAMRAQAKGMRVIYSAAPFSISAVQAVLPHLSILAVNEIEAAQLCTALGLGLDEIPVPQLLVTLGAKGAFWRSNVTGALIEVAAPSVRAVDTTAAGDTFIGYFAAGLDMGLATRAALDWASRAAALKVTRNGAADAIPDAQAVAAFKVD